MYYDISQSTSQNYELPMQLLHSALYVTAMVFCERDIKTSQPSSAPVVLVICIGLKDSLDTVIFEWHLHIPCLASDMRGMRGKERGLSVGLPSIKNTMRMNVYFDMEC